MNNEAELMEVKPDLQIAMREQYHIIIVEGDSAMVTGVLKKMKQGTGWEKISQSQIIARLIQGISTILPCIGYHILSHVRRGGNKVFDFLENWGWTHEGRHLDINQAKIVQEGELQSLLLIVDRDNGILRIPDQAAKWEIGAKRCTRPWIPHNNQMRVCKKKGGYYCLHNIMIGRMTVVSN